MPIAQKPRLNLPTLIVFSAASNAATPARAVVVALPDRAEAEDRDLPGVPIGQAVEAEDLVEDRVARGVPALVGIAAGVTRGCQQRRERALAREKLDEVGVPRVAER